MHRHAALGEVVAPCAAICPLHNEIPKWLALFSAGKTREAWELLTTTNPFPAILGRACYRFCETKCNHLATSGNAVKVGAIERSLGDLAIREAWQFSYPEAVKDSVLVVGAGPAGLMAAFTLMKAGVPVTLVDRETEVGGMMRFVIPTYRLPPAVVSSEVARILGAPHLTLRLGVNVDSAWINREKSHFAAIILAPGATLAKKLHDLPDDNTVATITALLYLRLVAQSQPFTKKNRVIVYGGGNTAMDAARTALRLGATVTTIIYHRVAERMSAAKEEIAAAREEGIRILCERTITALKDHQVQLVDQEGNTETLAADLVIWALSQQPDLQALPDLTLQDNGTLAVDNRQMTNFNGIFAAGDAVTNRRNLPTALASGRTAAQAVISYLENRDQVAILPDQLAVPGNPQQKLEKPQYETKLAVEKRIANFDEVNLGFDLQAAKSEAQRCYRCGHCIACGKCYTACPVGAIASDESSRQALNVDTKRCLGCGKCVRGCPTGAIAWHNSNDNVD